MKEQPQNFNVPSFSLSLSLDRSISRGRKEGRGGRRKKKRKNRWKLSTNKSRSLRNNSCWCPDPDKYKATSSENHAGEECISERKSGETRGKAMYRVIFSPIVSKESVIASKYCVSTFHFCNSFHCCRSHNRRWINRSNLIDESL